MGISKSDVYLIDYQSLRKLDCFEIIFFSLKNKNLKNDHMKPTEGFDLGKKAPLG